MQLLAAGSFFWMSPHQVERLTPPTAATLHALLGQQQRQRNNETLLTVLLFLQGLIVRMLFHLSAV